MSDSKKNGTVWKFEEVNRKLDTFSRTQSELLASIQEISSNVKQLTELSVKHDKVLYGNPENMGKDGVLMKMRDQESAIAKVKTEVDSELKNIKASIERDVKWFMSIFGFIWTAIITSFNWILKK